MTSHRHLMLYSAAALCMAPPTDKGDAAKKAADDAAAAELAALEAKKTPVERAVEANGARGEKPAITTADREHDGEFTDLTEANLAIIELRDQLVAAKTAHENEAADLRSRSTVAEQALETLKARMVAGTLTTTQRELAGDAAAALNDGERIDEAEAADDLVDVRVKTPMLVQPDERQFGWGDPIPAPFPLAKGLNKAPRWVADHWIVKANAEDEPA